MSAPINIFIIYAREDIGIKQRLLLHLNPFKTAFNAVIWHDGNIEAGQEWKPHIDSRLEQTDLFIMLVSIDFMNSEFINQVEFKYAIERHNTKRSIVIPVIINYCQWDVDIPFKDSTFNLNSLQVLPNEGKPIDDWKTAEQAYNNIAAGIRTVLSSIKGQREQEQRQKEQRELEIARAKMDEEKKQAIVKEKEQATDKQINFEQEKVDIKNIVQIKDEQKTGETKIDEEKKHATLKKEDQVKDKQINFEQEKVDIKNIVQIEDGQKTDETNTEEENQTIVINESPYPTSRKRIIIFAATLGVVILCTVLLINSKRSNNEAVKDVSAGNVDTAYTIIDSPAFDKKEEPAKEETKSEETKGVSVIPESVKEEKKEEEDKIYEKVEVEASFKGGNDGWNKYLEKNLNTNAPFDYKAPEGTYTTIIKFVVNKDGSIGDMGTHTNHGYGMEEEALRVIRKGPLWIPAIQNGRYVRSYRIQSITFKVYKSK